MKINIPKNEKLAKVSTDYVCLIDNSGSIARSVPALKQTMKAIVNDMNDSDTISIGTFSSHNDYEFFARGIKKNQNIDALLNSKITARGMTNFNDSLSEVSKIVKDVKIMSGNTNTVFYFLSDGYSNHYSPEDVTLTLCDSLRNVFDSKLIIGYGSNYNRNLLLDMTASIGGIFNHVSNITELVETGEKIVKNKQSTVTISLDKEYDIVWQVSGSDISILNPQNTEVKVLVSDKTSELFAIDFCEISEKMDNLDDAKFVYSLAYVLSQKNRANIGVSVLRYAGDLINAKKLQKAFTVSQKGNVENFLKNKVLNNDSIDRVLDAPPTISIQEFLDNIQKNVGKVSINTAYSKYNSISRKGDETNDVEFRVNDPLAKIISITGNENKANISFLTERKGEVLGINNPELQKKVEEHNTKIDKGELSEVKIEFPINSRTYRNYALVANGEFNFDKLELDFGDAIISLTDLDNSIDLFDDSVKDINIKDFVDQYKVLLEQKAHASVLRMYIEQNSEQKHLTDERVEKYGKEGAKILAELGLDYQLRYSPKSEYKKKDENADYVPFLEITAQLKGASRISASESYKKFTSVKASKPNVGDNICWPLFEDYETKLKALGKELFVKFCQTQLKGIESTIDVLSRKLSSTKFYLMITNSWFSGVDKSDELEYDGMVIKVKETKEYL